MRCAEAVCGNDRRRRRARCRAIIFADVAGEVMTEEVKLVLGCSPSASSTRLRRSWEPSLDLLRPPAAGCCWDEGVPRREGSMVAEASLCALKDALAYNAPNPIPIIVES